MFKKFQISVSSSPIFKKPSNSQTLETEALFGEIFFIKKSISDWAYGFLSTDNYHGWIETKNLEKCLETNYKIIVCRTTILSKPEVRSPSLFYLPLCSLIKVDKIYNEWGQISYIKNKRLRFGYVHLSHILKLDSKHKNWKSLAYNLLGIPYKWGGRDTVSIDCSSLVQLICNTQNIFLPRNTTEQILFLKKKYKHLIEDKKHYKNYFEKKSFKKGCVVFWDGHVGIIIDENKLLHANAFHNNVFLENINLAIERFSSQKIELKLICNLLT